MKKNKNVVNNLLELVGNTPMVKINKLTKDFAGTFLAKLESANPGHSSKDRIALHIVESAERKGILKPGDTIIETTSGNTGFSLAMVSLIKGYQCILAVSSKSSTDKIDMLRAMGAKVYVCPANVAADGSSSSGMRLQTAILPGSISVGSLAPSGKAHRCSIRESSESLTVENRSLIGHVSGF